MTNQQIVTVTCPNCHGQFTSPVLTIINGQEPAQKTALLQGQLNIAQCPQCGFVDALTVPMLYFDQEKEIAFVLAPNTALMTSIDQQKIIGNLTNTLVKSLPTEERKFYLLNPTQFLTLENMVKAILKADGITEEMLESQAAKTKLIQEFLKITDKNQLKATVKEHDDELDQDFFEILTATIQSAQYSGESAFAEALLGLRTLVARWSSRGKQIVANIDKEMETLFVQSQDELLEKLQTAQNDEEFVQIVIAGSPMLDYNFFQQLTGRIDDAEKNKDTKTVNELTALRAKILAIKEMEETKLKAALQEAAELLKKVIQSKQPEQVLTANLNQLDDTFFMVLSANIEEATRQKHEEAVKALNIIGNMAMAMLQQHRVNTVKKSQPANSDDASAPPAQSGPKIEIARR